MFSFNRGASPVIKAGKLFFGLFAVLGTLFLIVAAILLILKSNRLKGLERTDAVIIEQDEASTSTVVSYKVNGKIYRYRFSEYSSSDQIGDTVSIAYDKNAPDHPLRTGFMAYLAPAVLGFIGFVFSLVGWGGWLFFRRKPKEKVPWEMT